MDRDLERARAAWPDVDVPAEVFRAHLSARPDAIEIGDLYLACACARGDTAALAALERDHFAWLLGMLRKAGADDDSAAEVLQRLRQELLAPRPGREPGIAAFAGRS